MARIRIEDLRRRELAEATLKVMAENGYSGTTVARVGARAGMSAGMVHHYFRNKEELLEASLRFLQSWLGSGVAEGLRRARTPGERLRAVIAGNFAPELYVASHARVWISFLAEVPHRPENARLQRVIHARLRSNLMAPLRHYLAPAAAADVAMGIRVLIDGLWMQRATAAAEFPPERAVAEIDAYLAKRLPGWRPLGRLAADAAAAG